jgi:Secretion system C-terminal sorting domain
MKSINYLYIYLFFIACFSSNAQNKILFDASKAEEAGNADWIIDADTYNLGVGSSGPYIGGFESNPQRYPTPLQSGITASTTEDYWSGALSYWAIDCVKKGYTVETLPWNGQITYGNSSNPQDLSNYKTFVIDEPNILFTATQKTALLNFVSNGGSLFMIADHDVSDRNGDGYDSPHIWNDLFASNSLGINPFGFVFDYVDFTQTTSNVANLPTDPILHGTTGNVTQVKFSGGTTMTLNPAENASIKGVVFKTGSSTTGTLNAMCAYGTYGNGKFASVGDSSITEDGTGDPGDTLYDGYIADANGNHQKLVMNITNWLMSSTLSTIDTELNKVNFSIVPNPIHDKQLHLSFNNDEIQNTTIVIYDTLGRVVKTVHYNSELLDTNYTTISLENLETGVYVCQLLMPSKVSSLMVIVE